MRIGWGAAAILAAGLVGAAAGTTPQNSFSAALTKMSPGDRAARLAQIVGYWCVGTQTFLMGIAASGEETGNAYWSVACLDAQSYAIQIDPDGRLVTVPCSVLAETGKNRECFKQF